MRVVEALSGNISSLIVRLNGTTVKTVMMSGITIIKAALRAK